MVPAWLLFIAMTIGVGIGMVLFALLTVASDRGLPHADEISSTVD